MFIIKSLAKVSFVGAVVMSSAAFGAGVDPTGSYSGTCITHYGSGTGHCSVQLNVGADFYVETVANGDRCFSPVALSGLLEEGRRFEYTSSLQSPGWDAQPEGQTLDLTFTYRGQGWIASGQGGGVSDTAYWYRCSFRQN